MNKDIKNDALDRQKLASICTLGCKVNKYESEAIEELLVNNNYKIVDFAEFADVYIINTCTVTAMSEKKSKVRLNSAQVVFAFETFFEENADGANR